MKYRGKKRLATMEKQTIETTIPNNLEMKEIYKEFLMIDDKPHLSRVDIRQRFQFYVLLSVQNRGGKYYECS